MRERDHENPSGCPYMSESDIERIAEKAADKAVSKITNYVYIEVGRNVISKFLWITGAVVIGVSAWLHSKGLFP